MQTLISEPLPTEVQELLARRKQWRADTHDEVWEGVLHVVPAPHDRHADMQAQVVEKLGPLSAAA